MFVDLCILVLFLCLVFGLTFKFGPKLPVYILNSLGYLLTPRGKSTNSKKETKQREERKRVTINTLSASMATPVIDKPVEPPKDEVVLPTPIDYSIYESPAINRPLMSGRKLSSALV